MSKFLLALVVTSILSTSTSFAKCLSIEPGETKSYECVIKKVSGPVEENGFDLKLNDKKSMKMNFRR